MRILLAALIAPLSLSTYAQTDITDFDSEALMDAAQAMVSVDKESMLSDQLGLTDAERIEFWPLYDQYMVELGEVNERLVQLLIRYSETFEDVADDDALDMVDEYLDLEADRLAIRSKYVRRFDNILPAKKVARFVQLENRYKVLVDLAIASDVPLVQ